MEDLNESLCFGTEGGTGGSRFSSSLSEDLTLNSAEDRSARLGMVVMIGVVVLVVLLV